MRLFFSLDFFQLLQHASELPGIAEIFFVEIVFHPLNQVCSIIENFTACIRLPDHIAAIVFIGRYFHRQPAVKAAERKFHCVRPPSAF